MTRKLATVSRLPSGRGRGRPKTRLASAVDGSERELLVVLRRKLAAGIDQCTAGCGGGFDSSVPRRRQGDSAD